MQNFQNGKIYIAKNGVLQVAGILTWAILETQVDWSCIT